MDLEKASKKIPGRRRLRKKNATPSTNDSNKNKPKDPPVPTKSRAKTPVTNPRPTKKIRKTKKQLTEKVKPRKLRSIDALLSSTTQPSSSTAEIVAHKQAPGDHLLGTNNKKSAKKLANSKKQNPLEILPDDVLGNVFFSGYVNSIDILTNVSLVCKKFRQIAHSSVKLLDLRALPKLEASDVASIVARHGNLSSLDFGYCPQFGKEHLMALVPISPTLHKLCLRGTCVKDTDVVEFLEASVTRLGGTPTVLQEIDLSAIKKEETPRIGDDSVVKIAVSWLK